MSDRITSEGKETKKVEGKMYKKSKYNFLLETDDGFLLVYNSKTGAFAAVPGDLKGKVSVLIEDPSAGDREELLVQELSNGGFIVENQKDESGEVREIYENYKKDNLKNVLTLLASENCNFSCPYCFVYERRGFNMKPWVYDAVMKHIEKNIPENSQLKINWFGGEPTLSHNAIVDFMGKLNAFAGKKNIKLLYSMVTNGYLLDKKKFSEYLKLGLNMFQITLDGNEVSHDRTRCLVNGKGTFKVIWENLEKIKELPEYYDMAIRVNFLKGMEPEIDVLARKFADKFGKDERFNIYFRPVYDFKTTREDVCEVKENIYSLKEGIYKQMKYNLLSASLSGKIRTNTLLSNPVPRPVPAWCDTEKQNFYVVGADGKLFKCDSYIGNKEQAVGELTEEGDIRKYPGAYNWNKNVYEEPETAKCRDCRLLPICQGGCPRMRKEQKGTCYLSEEQLKFALLETHKFNLSLQSNKSKEIL